PGQAQWCDFCKEPFRKAVPAPLPAAQADPRAAAQGAEAGAGIPSEFLALDSGGRIPAPPPWLRYAVWSVLGACVLLIMSLLGAYLARQGAPQNAQPSVQFSQ
ncbi:MAG: hypothetical protein PHU21_11115, partial [Elusimicrobia bacterium]|nr:hypothetical protein [Elusimicrobiota bacterium]